MNQDDLRKTLAIMRSPAKKAILIHLWERGSASVKSLVRAARTTEKVVKHSISDLRIRNGLVIELIDDRYHLDRERQVRPKISERPLNGLSESDRLLNEVFK